MQICDLHTHSVFSDGSCTPQELIRLAEEAGVSALALTDHNTAKGLPEFMRAAADSRVTAVPGCEFTAEFNGREVHIVGLFLPEASWPEIEIFVEPLYLAKIRSNRDLIRALQADGYALTWEEIAALTESDAFNRAHVARALAAKGYVGSVKEAFETLLGEGGGYYTPAKKLSSTATIRFIKSFGGVAVLAHPFVSLDDAQLEAFLPQAKEAGLDAMETVYPLYSPETARKAAATAERFALLPSGGTDFHGEAKPDVALGTGRGTRTPFAFYEALKERAES